MGESSEGLETCSGSGVKQSNDRRGRALWPQGGISLEKGSWEVMQQELKPTNHGRRCAS